MRYEAKKIRSICFEHEVGMINDDRRHLLSEDYFRTSLRALSTYKEVL